MLFLSAVLLRRHNIPSPEVIFRRLYDYWFLVDSSSVVTFSIRVIVSGCSVVSSSVVWGVAGRWWWWEVDGWGVDGGAGCVKLVGLSCRCTLILCFLFFSFLLMSSSDCLLFVTLTLVLHCSFSGSSILRVSDLRVSS